MSPHACFFSLQLLHIQSKSLCPGLQNYNHTWLRNIAEGEAPVIQSALGCLTPAIGISVVASAPTGAPSPAEALASASAAAPSPSGMSPNLATIVDGNTSTVVSCPATAAMSAPTICPFVQPCRGAAPSTLTNSTVSCSYVVAISCMLKCTGLCSYLLSSMLGQSCCNSDDDATCQ